MTPTQLASLCRLAKPFTDPDMCNFRHVEIKDGVLAATDGKALLLLDLDPAPEDGVYSTKGKRVEGASYPNWHILPGVLHTRPVRGPKRYGIDLRYIARFSALVRGLQSPPRRRLEQVGVISHTGGEYDPMWVECPSVDRLGVTRARLLVMPCRL